MTDYQHIEVAITVDGDHHASYTIARRVGEGTAVITYQENEHAPAPRRAVFVAPCAPCHPFALAVAKGVAIWQQFQAEREQRQPLPVADSGEVTA